MKWVVTEAVAITDKMLRVQFADGTVGTVKFQDSYFKNVFEALKDPSVFAKVVIENDTVTWPDEIDIAPDALYERIKAGHGECTLS